MKIVATVIFSGDMSPDPDACSQVLIKAGYEVTRMPEQFKKLLSVSGDEFLEATKDGDGDEIFNELNKLVDPYGAIADDVGEIEEGHIPFGEYITGWEARAARA